MASALDAAADDRLAAMREDKCQKQRQRFRLTADPTISVTALVSILVNFLKYRETKDLETCVEPPPSGPVSFGWHSAPAPNWLVKVSALLYDLLGVCKNSKDLELRINKKHSAEDCMDHLGFMIRVLLNMVRNLKSSYNLKMKAWRCLGRAEQVRLDLVLDPCILPPELTAGAKHKVYSSGPAQGQWQRQWWFATHACSVWPGLAWQQRTTGCTTSTCGIPQGSSQGKARRLQGKETYRSRCFGDVLDHTPAASLKKPKAAPKKPKEKRQVTKSKKTKTKKAKKQKDKKEKIKVEEAKSSQAKKKNKQQAKVESGAGKDSTKSEVGRVQAWQNEKRTADLGEGIP
eukprot:s40_g13.t1